MDIRKHLHNSLTISALALIVVCAFPNLAQAVSIGEVSLQSRLGQPLLAQVELVVGSDENIDDSCLSLTLPDATEDEPGGYLTKAFLALKSEGNRQYISISSRKPLEDAFAKLRLQVKCLDTGSVIKTLTILPDLIETSPQAEISPPVAPSSAKIIASISPPELRAITATASPIATPGTVPDAKANHGKKALPGSKQLKSQTKTASGKDGATSFKLKLSGEPMDESRIGKISTAERAMLLARQKLLDADDQTASFLAMQHQVKQLQDELGEIKLQLAQLGVNPASLAASAPLPAEATPATGELENHPKPVVAAKPPVSLLANQNLRDGLVAAFGLVFLVFLLWLGLRYYTKSKSRAKITSQPEVGIFIKEPVHAVSPKIAQSLALKSAPQVAAAMAKADPEQTIVVPPKASTFRNELSQALPATQKIEPEVTEEDSMLEEAGLYASHGRPAKAVEILQEIIKRRPSKAEAWPLLLSIYSSLAKATEFEKTARAFLLHHKDSPAWSGIQALGRTFDQNNPLYTDGINTASASPLLPDAGLPRRPVGDVLIEMGVLSKQDLQNCLDDFDPKKHGRFGGYLVARKVITLAQLDQALLQQQGVSNEVKPGTLPSLQEMENFLADFDPKRDGSVGEFLAARNAVTQEQLSNLLQQKSTPPVATLASQAEQSPPAGEKSATDFVLGSSSSFTKLDFEFEPANGQSKPLDFEVESSPFSFPEKKVVPENKNLPAKTLDFE
jgi:hypothetical protein